MSFDKYFYVKDDIIYLHFPLQLLIDNKLSTICDHIYNHFFLKYDDIKIEIYLDKINITYFVEHLNTIMKYGKLIKENFNDKQVHCNIYSYSKTIAVISKLLNEIDKEASSRITFHELTKLQSKQIFI
jgi:hypothetical protein